MSFSTADRRSPQSWLLLAIFIAVVLGVGGLIGTTFQPGTWYAELEKPPFNPPNWVFGPVWSTLYVMIGIAGWRIWTSAPKSGAMKLWFVQMLLNWAWTPIWFGANQPWAALIALLILLARIIGFIAASWNRDRLAAWLFVPYLAWVAFATLLNASIAILNS